MNLETKYAVALTKLYGMVHPTVVIDIYNRQNEIKISSLSKVDRDVLFKEHIYFDKGYFVHEAIHTLFNFSKHYEQQHIKKLYVPNKDELLKYAGYYFEKNDYYEKLERFIDDHFDQFENVVVEYLLYDVHGFIMSEASVETILEITQLNQLKNLTEKESEELEQILVACKNNTRIWFNNGHTVIELVEAKLSTPRSIKYDVSEMVGNIKKDDACPCGSGEIYEECCLKYVVELKDVHNEIEIQEQVDAFVEKLLDFAEISCIILDVGIPTDDLIKEVSMSFNVLFDEYQELGNIRDRMITGSLIHLLISSTIDCIQQFEKEKPYGEIDEAFEYIFNKISENDNDYLYSLSKLYGKSEWNNDNTSNLDRKLKYYMDFASDYLRETGSLLASADDDEKIENEIEEIITEYVDDLSRVFVDCFGLFEIISFINLQIDNIANEIDEF